MTPARKAAEPRPLHPFRVHFSDASVTPLDVEAHDPSHARAIAEAERPDVLIAKIKRIREG